MPKPSSIASSKGRARKTPGKKKPQIHFQVNDPEKHATIMQAAGLIPTSYAVWLTELAYADACRIIREHERKSSYSTAR